MTSLGESSRSGPAHDWHNARLAWCDVGLDVAVLVCPDLGAAADVWWGRLEGSEPVKWKATGFRAASRDVRAHWRPEEPYGRAAPASLRDAGQLALSIESRLPRREEYRMACRVPQSSAATFSSVS